MSQDKDKLPAELARTDEDWRNDPRLDARLHLAIAREYAERLRKELADAEAAVRCWSDILGEAP
jgi:hypothetical protein